MRCADDQDMHQRFNGDLSANRTHPDYRNGMGFEYYLAELAKLNETESEEMRRRVLATLTSGSGNMLLTTLASGFELPRFVEAIMALVGAQTVRLVSVPGSPEATRVILDRSLLRGSRVL